MVVFAMLGTVMFVSKIAMEALPNIHLLGMLIIAYTAVFRAKALIPIYIYVFLNGLFAGFNMWWIPYLYIWTVLWALAMLIPRKAPRIIKLIIYPALCAFHGFAFGALYAPVQALIAHFTFEQTLTWIAAGFTFDIIHGIGNFTVGLLALPVSTLLEKIFYCKRI